MESQCGEYDITLYDLVISFSLYLQSVSRKTQKHMIQLLNPAAPDFVPLCNIQSATPMPGAWLQDQSSVTLPRRGNAVPFLVPCTCSVTLPFKFLYVNGEN